ncbi:response regulator [Rhodobacterales bacterium]|nr:response regulator [Rhodobacterales bacterium]
MSCHFENSRAAVEQAARATRSVIIVLIFLVCAMVVILTFLVKREGELHDAIREDAIWAVYQLDRETRALYELVHEVRLHPDERDPSTGELAVPPNQVVVKYDILYSRLSVLANSKYNSYFEQSAAIKAKMAAIRDSILSIEPIFNQIDAQQSYQGIELGRIDEVLGNLRGATNTFLVRTNASVSAGRADARDSVFRAQMLALLFMGAIAVAAVLLAFNLLRQLRLVRRTREELSKVAIELENAFEAAESGNKAKSAFMATIGHEIRTPLNAILGMSDLLATSNLRPEDAEHVSTISTSGRALLEMLNEILDFAKIENGSLHVEMIAFSLEKLITETVSVIEGEARRRNNSLLVEMDPALQGQWFKSDPTILKRILLNLLSNAVKFTENGRVRVSARSGTLSEGTSGLFFEVSDTGLGIPEAAQAKLFTAFHQVDSSISRRFGGTGLGLAISKQMVETLGGRIGVSSAPGKGSSFRFEIPAETTPALQDTEQSLPAITADLPRLQVLVVEDNTVNQRVAVKFLERLGQQPTVARSGAKALSVLRTRSFDLVLMDVQMPVMDGISATREIRKLGGAFATLPIIAMTADASDRHRQECFDAGMNGFEAKPLTFQRLGAVLRDHGPGQENQLTQVQAEPKHVTGADSASASADIVDFNEARQSELIQEFGAPVYEDLAVAFFENAEELVLTAVSASRNGDRATYDRALHTLRGAAENLGFLGIASTAHDLRAASGTDSPEARLRIAIDQAKSRFRRMAI